MTSIPVNNPQIPFLGQIPGGFRPSLMVRVKGKIIKRGGRCVIDFVATPALNVGQDVIFHTSIRLNEGVMVRNAFINRKWGPEDRYGKFEFKHNKTFEIIFLAELEHYKIAVNGIHIGVFRHRLPLNLVNYIHVSGDVTIDHILLEQDMQSAQVAHVISSITPGTLHQLPHGTNVIGSVITSTPAYTPYQPPQAPQIQISYQPPNIQQPQMPYPPVPIQNNQQTQMPYPTVQPSAPYPPQQTASFYNSNNQPPIYPPEQTASFYNSNNPNQPPPPYNPKWL